MRYTDLHKEHRTLGAKFLEFNGWEMPLFYQGILPEHLATRQAVAMFDVSHMGRVSIRGKEAAVLLEYLSANEIKKPGVATYTVWCDANGGTVDDLLVFCSTPTEFFVVVNAGNREKDLAHIKSYSQHFSVDIQDHYSDEGILAVQGPLARQTLAELFPESQTLLPMHFIHTFYKGCPLILSATGYTGSGGFELYAPSAILIDLWQTILAAGKAHKIVPAGLGARDTLRLEMGYALYGHELSPSVAPTESIAAWSVKLDRHAFLGKQALQSLEKSAHKRSAVAIRLLESGVMRDGLSLFKDGKEIGKTTSGTFSPTLKYSIALAIVNEPMQMGQHLDILIRNRLLPVEVTSLPFIRHSTP